MTTRYVTILLVTLATLCGCSDDKVNSTAQSGKADSLSLPDSELTGARITLSERGRVTTEILCRRIQSFDARDSTMAYVVNVTSFDSTGSATGHVVADSAVIHEASGEFNLYDHVVLITENETKLETDYLYWNSRTDQIETDAYVRITRGDDVVTGWGLRADQQLDRVRILNTEKGTITDTRELSEP